MASDEMYQSLMSSVLAFHKTTLKSVKLKDTGKPAKKAKTDKIARVEVARVLASHGATVGELSGALERPESWVKNAIKGVKRGSNS